MKFVIAKEEFNRLVGSVQSVAAQKPTIPILSNVLIEAQGDELILTATDLTVGTRCHVPAKILEGGATTVPAKRLSSLIRELTAATVEFSSNENDVSEIVADTSRFKLHGMSKGEYPSLPNLEGALQFSIKQSVLQDMFFRTSFAVAREENRYILTGVLMQIADGTATFVGTDGKRLAKMQTSIDIDPSASGSYVLPLKAVEEVMKNLKESDEEATLYLMENKIAIATGSTTIITKLLSGEYPDFRRVIPEKAAVELSLHREEMISLLRQVALFTVDNDHSVRFTFVSGELQLMANSLQIGEGKVSMPVNYEGERFDIAFNPNYFLDILRHSKDETITLGITDAYSPGILSDSSGVLFVIMPMRLNEE